MCDDEMSSIEKSDLDKFGVTQKRFDNFKKVFNTLFPDTSYGIFFVYFLKPLIIGFIMRCRRLSNQTYYTSDVFFMRLTYDVLFILTSCLYPFIAN